MTSNTALTLKCKNCGHVWNARNTQGKARQCSKCRSRRIKEAIPENNHPFGNAPLKNKDEEKDSKPLIEYQEVQDQIKKAQLVRNEGEETLSSLENVIMRMVADHKMLLTMLRNHGFLSEGEFECEISMCPWCGFGTMYEVESEDTWGWRCRKCGREAV